MRFKEISLAYVFSYFKVIDLETGEYAKIFGFESTSCGERRLRSADMPPVVLIFDGSVPTTLDQMCNNKHVHCTFFNDQIDKYEFILLKDKL